MPQRLNVSGNYEVRINGTTRTVVNDSGMNLTGTWGVSGAATFESATVSMANLPTSDPSVAGRLWVDTGAANVVKMSQG